MKRFAKLLTAALLSAVVSANVIAFMQARAMTNFTGGGERSAGPEQLSLLDGLAQDFLYGQLMRTTGRGSLIGGVGL